MALPQLEAEWKCQCAEGKAHSESVRLQEAGTQWGMCPPHQNSKHRTAMKIGGEFTWFSGFQLLWYGWVYKAYPRRPKTIYQYIEVQRKIQHFFECQLYARPCTGYIIKVPSFNAHYNSERFSCPYCSGWGSKAEIKQFVSRGVRHLVYGVGGLEFRSAWL